MRVAVTSYISDILDGPRVFDRCFSRGAWGQGQGNCDRRWQGQGFGQGLRIKCAFERHAELDIYSFSSLMCDVRQLLVVMSTCFLSLFLFSYSSLYITMDGRHFVCINPDGGGLRFGTTR